MRDKLVSAILVVIRSRILFGAFSRMRRLSEWIGYVVFHAPFSKERDPELLARIERAAGTMRGKNEICFEPCPTIGGRPASSYYERIRGTLWHLAIIAFRTVDRSMVISTIKRVCADYQLVLAEAGFGESSAIDSGCLWVFWNILKHSSSPVLSGKIVHDDAVALADEFCLIIAEKGKKAFGTANGEITADKIIYGPYGQIYLASLGAAIRPGRGIYDAIHAIAWMFYNSIGDAGHFMDTVLWTKNDVCGCDSDKVREAKAILALEMLIFLSRDMSPGRTATCGDGNRAQKILNMIRLIRREW